MPPSPSPNHDDLYAHLITALHPSPPAITEIEILPSHYPPEILHEPPFIGIPKSLLVPLFLKARSTFFNHISSPISTESYHPALQATAIILLFDPNHITAANFRKRHILRLSGSGRRSEDGQSDEKDAGSFLVEGVRLELKFLESLVTSPLSKHAKSSTLWAQRLWVVRNFSLLAMREHITADDDKGVQELDRGHVVRGFWDGELAVVMKAGERHPRNYYAWQYARQLFFYLCSEHAGQGDWCRKVLLRDSIGLMRRWCLMHPRDVSGWAFLVFLLEQRLNQGCDEGDGRNGSKDGIGVSASETREFVRKYEWNGESIEWFLKAMRTLDIDY